MLTLCLMFCHPIMLKIMLAQAYSLFCYIDYIIVLLYYGTTLDLYSLSRTVTVLTMC